MTRNRRGGRSDPPSKARKGPRRERALPAWLTLIGAIFLLLVGFAAIFFFARGCVATQEATQVRKYVTSSASLLNDSSNAGKQDLQNTLSNAKGQVKNLNKDELRGAADNAQLLYQRALDNNEVPPEFQDGHHYLISALGIRFDATERIAKAASGNPSGFVKALSESVEDYKVSDSIIRNHYLPESRSALEKAGQSSDQGYLQEPDPFMDYEQIGFDVAAAKASGAVVQDDPNALHGVEITSVEIAGQQLYSGGNVTLTGSDKLVFNVTVTNGGEVAEQAVPVEIILNTKAERQSQKATIESIEPNGGSKSIEVSGFKPGELDEAADVTIEAGPVKYEEYTDNNALTGTVTFGL